MKNSVFIEGTNAVAISWSPNFDEFLSELKIAPNTFASTILERVFQFYFVESVDVKFDYDRFYSIEYNSLGNFIEAKYGITLDEHALNKDHIFIYGDWTPEIMSDAYDENVLAQVTRCLVQLEEKNEN